MNVWLTLSVSWYRELRVRLIVAVKIRTLSQQECRKLEVIMMSFLKVSAVFSGIDGQTGLSTREILKRGKIVKATAFHCWHRYWRDAGQPRRRGRDQKRLGVQRDRSSWLNPAKLIIMMMMMIIMIYSCFGGVFKWTKFQCYRIVARMGK
jgi:hypothetical protein